MNRLSGYTCVRNAIELDYAIEECVDSLLKVCDEVVICDSDSTDGTRELLGKMAQRSARIRIINRPWPDPRGDTQWWVKWMNFTREHLKYEMQFQLDADEVLDDSPASLQAIRNAVHDGHCITVDRLNFWRDPFSLIPDGHCCGKWVTRLGPSDLWMPSDEPHHRGELEILDRAQRQQDIRIFHLGFLRRKKAFYEKSKVVLHAFFNRWDPRLEDGERRNVPLHQTECEFTKLLVPYRGNHPPAVKEWLRRRGYQI